MEDSLASLIVGGGLGLLGAMAGLAVPILIWRGSFTRWLAARPDAGVAPVSRDELMLRLLALDNPKRPFSYRPDDRYDLRAEWRLADASWWGVFQRNHLSASYLARVYLHERHREVRVFESWGRLEWSAGMYGVVPRVSWRRQFFRGVILFRRTKEIAYGIKDELPLDWGKVVDYDFDVWRIKGPILRTAVESGWTFCPVVHEGHLTADRRLAA